MTVRDATVGPLFGTSSRIWLRHFDVVVVDPERIGCDLRKERVGALANLRAEASTRTLPRRSLDRRRSNSRCALAGPGEASAVHERREPNSFLDAARRIVSRERCLLASIVGQIAALDPEVRPYRPARGSSGP